jgi:hypothetical protein
MIWKPSQSGDGHLGNGRGDMSENGLVDVSVPMAAYFERKDEQSPEAVRLRQLAAANRLIASGFSRDEVFALYPGLRVRPESESVQGPVRHPEHVAMAALLLR